MPREISLPQAVTRHTIFPISRVPGDVFPRKATAVQKKYVLDACDEMDTTLNAVEDQLFKIRAILDNVETMKREITLLRAEVQTMRSHAQGSGGVPSTPFPKVVSDIEAGELWSRS
jgi:hypothetical protein